MHKQRMYSTGFVNGRKRAKVTRPKPKPKTPTTERTKSFQSDAGGPGGTVGIDGAYKTGRASARRMRPPKKSMFERELEKSTANQKRREEKFKKGKSSKYR